MIPIAHAGHWLASLLYIVPIVLVVGGLVFTAWREKRRQAKEGDAPPAPPESA